MEDRTELKEKRNSWLWLVWIILTITFSYIFPIIYETENKSEHFIDKICLSAIFFCFISTIYRFLTFCLNYILAKIIKKRFKINRIKGRVTPIYKIDILRYGGGFSVSKHSIKYTKLDLEWSIPFSFLFLEQEYICDGKHITEKLPSNLEDFWEEQEAFEKCVEDSISRKKAKKEQKINNLNKVFNENYK